MSFEYILPEIHPNQSTKVESHSYTRDSTIDMSLFPAYSGNEPPPPDKPEQGTIIPCTVIQISINILFPGTVWLNNKSFLVVSDLPESSGSSSKVDKDIPEPSQMIEGDPVQGEECPQGTSTLFPAYVDTKGETSTTESASKGNLIIN